MSVLLLFLAMLPLDLTPWIALISPGLLLLFGGFFYFKGDGRYVKRDDMREIVTRLETLITAETKRATDAATAFAADNMREVARLEEADKHHAIELKDLAGAMDKHETMTRQIMHDMRNSINQHFLNFTETLGKMQGQMAVLISMKRNGGGGDSDR